MHYDASSRYHIANEQSNHKKNVCSKFNWVEVKIIEAY